MKTTINAFLDRMASQLPAGNRALLEAIEILIARTAEAAIDAETLRAELEIRQSRAIAPAAFRQRLKRLNDALKERNAPFLLASAGGRISVQQTARGDAEQHAESVGEGLRRHSNEGTFLSVASSVPPLAKKQEPKMAPGLLVMFSYAWLNEGKVGQQLHRIQDEFFNETSRQLRDPPARFSFLPPIELWRDAHKMGSSDQGNHQIDAACQRAFLCLLMLSHKYQRSEDCLREAQFFLAEDGRNRAGKHCIVVPVDIEHRDAPPRLSVAAIFDGGGGKLFDGLPASASRTL